MSATQNRIALGSGWVDLVAGDVDLNGVPILVQNVGGGIVEVVFGGATAPATTTGGLQLEPRDSIQGTAANVWARCTNAVGAVVTHVV